MIRFLAASAVAAARSTSFWLIFVAAFFLVVPIVPVRGDITPDGDVSPADPSTWTSATVGYIGNTASGTLTVDGTSSLQSGDSFMGYHEGTVGAVNVVGTGATWTNSGCIYVGSSGSGTLSITNGGNVTRAIPASAKRERLRWREAVRNWATPIRCTRQGRSRLPTAEQSTPSSVVLTAQKQRG